MNFSDFSLFSPTDEHKMLRETVRDFVNSEVDSQALEYDRKEEFNLSLFRQLGDLGLLGITVPDEYGGSNMDALAAVIVHEEISSSDPGFCLAYLAHSMLLVNNLCVNGSNDLKSKFLPGLCSGELIGAMAMSEPDAGTDVLGLSSMAKKVGREYILNGRKMWITNGTIDEKGTAADCVLVYARVEGENDSKKITTFLVEKGFPGYLVGQKIKDKLGMRASNTAELVFEDCKIPESNRIGAEGDSLLHMMRNLEIERLTLAAMSLGMARRALQIMNKYAQERHSFGKPLNYFGQIQQYIATSYAEFMAARTYVYDCARRMKLDREGTRMDSDGVKLFASTMAKNVCDRAIQVLGGYGYVGEYHVERLWRDAKLIEIGGGTIEAHQKNITKDLTKMDSNAWD